MSIYNLNALFHPRSVAVVEQVPGEGRRAIERVIRGLLAAGFDGPILPVAAGVRSIAGVLAYPNIAALPLGPDMAVLCGGAEAVAPQVAALGERGCRAAVLLSAGRTTMRGGADNGEDGALAAAARQHGMRLLGPGSAGLLVPKHGLSVGLAGTGGIGAERSLPGRVACVVQSGAVGAAVLDWAVSRGVGFSSFVVLGRELDVDLGDVIDFLASDPDSRAILLHVEHVGDARKFLSAARAAARNKPIVAIRSGRGLEATSVQDGDGVDRSGLAVDRMAVPDRVYDAAFERAGILRVGSIGALFDSVETLTLARSLPADLPDRDRLVVVSNGVGPARMALDDLHDRHRAAGGGKLAEIGSETREALSSVPGLVVANPLDLGADTDADRYGACLRPLLADRGVDAVMVLHAPSAWADPAAVAETVSAAAVATSATRRKTVLPAFLGVAAEGAARPILHAAGLPSYHHSRAAVNAFLQMVAYRRSQDMLMQTPPAAPEAFEPDLPDARTTLAPLVQAGGGVTDEPTAKRLLAAYGLPVVTAEVAADLEAAVTLSERIGFPVALKLLSPDVVRRSDVGGVALDLDGSDQVRAAAAGMAARLAHLQPDARLTGYTVQRMQRRPGAHELLIGAVTDPVFGPVLLFGAGGAGADLVDDLAIALPPLNVVLADRLIAGTRVSRLLDGYGGRPAIDRDALRLALLKLSQIVVDLPEVAAIEINPLLAGPDGVLALDARVAVRPIRPGQGVAGHGHRLAIRPYPGQLEEWFTLRNGRRVLLRPIRPEDEPAHRAFIGQITPEDIRFRFFGMVRELPKSEMARLTQIDYDREMAFVAKLPGDGEIPGGETLGVVRTVTDPDNRTAEYAVLVRSDLKGQGLGAALMRKIIAYSRARGTQRIVGEVLSDNRPMLGLCRHLGFGLSRDPDDPDVTRVVLPLAESQPVDRVSPG